jgi:hypothetical protein
VEFILLKDAIQQMETTVDGRPARFTVAVVGLDNSRGTGGELHIFKDVCLNDVKQNFTSAVPEQYQREQAHRFTNHKNPNHTDNGTRNLRLRNGQIRKIHTRLITQFNNLTVIY